MRSANQTLLLQQQITELQSAGPRTLRTQGAAEQLQSTVAALEQAASIGRMPKLAERSCSVLPAAALSAAS